MKTVVVTIIKNAPYVEEEPSEDAYQYIDVAIDSDDSYMGCFNPVLSDRAAALIASIYGDCEIDAINGRVVEGYGF